MNEQSDIKRAPSLVSDILAHLSNLVRKEFDLARSEVSESLDTAAIAVGLLVGAIVIALTALNVLSAALVAGLMGFGLDNGWAALIVGGGLAVIAFAMLSKGVNDLKLANLAPTRTVENVKRDANVVKESLND